ncbi:hypothetical protein QA612_02775 [Evansella sp. AB-P1]|uniref:hypothetical protein n=1 Tax=Evansella sp. AB-P1 TaxID=3037653 RepID=UPI00241C96B2|nr:hypothetical protein [Evansella sp. AB-P1]MDG5786399.1 hypothetical protein [Evansella sp. AB-P1]
METINKLADLSYGEFQQQLNQYILTQLEASETTSPLIYFPIINDRVEVFLIAHWEYVWKNCLHMTWNDWLYSECYTLFREEVVNDLLHEIDNKEEKETVIF